MKNERTKGFWIGILIMPIMFIGIFFVQSTLSQSTPTRYYLLIDQSDQYREAVQAAIDREHQRRILQGFIGYLLDYRKEADLELTSANATSAADQLVDNVSTDEVSALNEWFENGGLDFALTMAAPYLREDAPPFVRPDQQFIEAPLPSGIDADGEPEAIIEQLRPYLNGDIEVSVNGVSGEVFALILVPEEINNFIVRPNTMPVQDGNKLVGFQYWARNLTDSRLLIAIEQSINNEIRNNEFFNNGLDTQLVRNIQRTRLPLSKLDPRANEGE